MIIIIIIYARIYLKLQFLCSPQASFNPIGASLLYLLLKELTYTQGKPSHGNLGIIEKEDKKIIRAAFEVRNSSKA